MKKTLLATTALVVAISPSAFSEMKIKGNLEQTFRATSHDGTSDMSSANNFGQEGNISVSNSKDLDNGMTAKVGFTLEADSTAELDTSYLTVGTDAFDITVGRDYGTSLTGSMIPKVGDEFSTLAGALGTTALVDQVGDERVHDGQSIALNAKGIANGAITVRYSSGIGDNNNDDGAVADNGKTGYEVLYKGKPVDGLAVRVGMSEVNPENEASDGESTMNSYGASYNFGSVTVGAERSEHEDGATTETELERTAFGIAFAASDSLSVGIQSVKQEKTKTGSTFADEEATVFSIGYSLGGLGLEVSYADVEGLNHSSTAKDAEVIQIRTVQKF